jgi:hypothetical protein
MKIKVHNRLISQATLPAIHVEPRRLLPSFGSAPDSGIKQTTTITDGLLDTLLLAVIGNTCWKAG